MSGKWQSELTPWFKALKAMTNYDSDEFFNTIKSLKQKKNEVDRSKDNLEDWFKVTVELGYPELFVKILVWKYSHDSFKKPDQRENEQQGYFATLIPFSYSKAFGKALAEHGLIPMILRSLKEYPAQNKGYNTKPVQPVHIKYGLGTLNNLAYLSECLHIFRQHQALEVFEPYAVIEDEWSRTCATLCIICILDEKDHSSIQDMKGTIDFMVKSTGQALSSPSLEYRGFHITEFLDGLDALAANDKNKRKIVDARALPIFTAILKSKNTGIHGVVLQIIWNLSFDDELKVRIKQEPGLLDCITQSMKSTDSAIKTSATGITWKLKGEEIGERKLQTSNGSKKGQPAAASSPQTRHVFISYQWDHQGDLVKLKDRLKADGYKVWMDVEQMTGSTLEAMADGIESAYVVLICMSEKYKKSPNCRTEAEYTFKKRPFIPLMMQRHYDPDGWLGLMVGTRFYVNFDGKYSFDQAYSLLTKELQNNAVGKEEAIQKTEVQKTTSVNTESEKPGVDSWTVSYVQQWMENNKLTKARNALKNYNGRMLNELRVIRQDAPEYFYRTIETKFGLDLPETLLLSRAIRDLPR